MVKSFLLKTLYLVHWQKPFISYIKLNIDGASRKNSGAARTGGIIRDRKNNVLVAFSEFLGAKSNNYAELSALYTGLFICYQLEVSSIIIESDSKILVDWHDKRINHHGNLVICGKNIQIWGQWI